MTRRRILPTLLASIALAVVAVAAAHSASPHLHRKGTQYILERGDVAYSFDAAWRVEALWRVEPDGSWSRIPSPDPAAVDVLRRAFLHRAGFPSLDRVPGEGAAELKALAALGYL